MIALAEQLQSQGAAYRNEDLFYSVRSFPAYGKLSGRSPDDMRAGARIDPDDRKRDPLDFVLWKASKPHEDADAIWPSPWGRG